MSYWTDRQTEMRDCKSVPRNQSTGIHGDDHSNTGVGTAVPTLTSQTDIFDPAVALKHGTKTQNGFRAFPGVVSAAG